MQATTFLLVAPMHHMILNQHYYVKGERLLVDPALKLAMRLGTVCFCEAGGEGGL